VHTELKWTYEPQDLFEQPTELEVAGHLARADEGIVTVHLPGDQSQDSALRDHLEETLSQLLRGQALARRRHSALLPGSTAFVDDQGNRSISLSVGCAVTVCTGGKADFVIKRGDGTIVRDTRAERICRQAGLAELVGRWGGRDSALDKMLDSHARAAADPRNFLIHLYEIREALGMRHRGDSRAREVLGISAARWSRLGLLTNDLPLLEGRHRGKHQAELRPASAAEQEEAWGLADELIEAYLRWLDLGVGRAQR
jgi:hypothetical protein